MIIAGLGVAAYHPEATKHAAWIARERPATAMSLFSIGGNLGVALGPLAAGFVAAHYGLHGAALLVIPAALVAALMLGEPAAARARRRRRRGEGRREHGARAVRELVILLWRSRPGVTSISGS